MRRRKVDLNQAEFVRMLLGCGLTVADIHAVGGGLPDILVGGHSLRHGQAMNLLVEIKSRGKLNRVTSAEVEFEEWWRGPRMRTESVDDVLRFFGLVE